MTADVRFCTSSDGTRIAYGVAGEGPALLFCPQICEQFSQLHTVHAWQGYVDAISAGCRRVQWDHRGTGLSNRDIHDFTLGSRLLDLEAVVDAAELDTFALYGSLLGGPLAIAYAVRHPQRVSRLVLYGTYSRGVDVMPWEQLSGIIELARGNWSLAAQVLADFSTREQHPEAGVQIADHFRASSTGAALAEGLSQGYHETDVTDVLSDVRAPTLILHRREDTVVPFAVGQQLAAGIPNARFVPLDGAVHAEFLGDSAAVVHAVRTFLTGEEPAPPARSAWGQAPIVVMFTDIEDSTPLTQRLGDVDAHAVIRTHNSIVRNALGRHYGSEVKHTGDGIMASFPSVSLALDCALEMRRTFDEHNHHAAVPLGVRIGLNAGEPILEDSDLFGAAVQIARRICDEADTGQIVVSNVVRELAAGKGITFRDLGERPLKGFDEPFRLFEVRPPVDA